MPGAAPAEMAPAGTGAAGDAGLGIVAGMSGAALCGRAAGARPPSIAPSVCARASTSGEAVDASGCGVEPAPWTDVMAGSRPPSSSMVILTFPSVLVEDGVARLEVDRGAGQVLHGEPVGAVGGVGALDAHVPVDLRCS